MNYQNYKELITVLSLFVFIVMFVFRFQKIKLKDVVNTDMDDVTLPLINEIMLMLVKMVLFVFTAAGGMFMVLWFLQEGFKFIETNILN